MVNDSIWLIVGALHCGDDSNGMEANKTFRALSPLKTTMLSRMLRMCREDLQKTISKDANIVRNECRFRFFRAIDIVPLRLRNVQVKSHKQDNLSPEFGQILLKISIYSFINM